MIAPVRFFSVRNFTGRFYMGLLAMLAGAMVLSAPLSAQDDGFVTYEVRQGDTLYGLSRQYMQREADALRVQRINRIANPRRMPVNTRLRIPREVLRYTNVELRVVGFSGPVNISGRAPTVGTVLGEGQVVTTGRAGFVSFRATNGGEVSLPSNTKAQLLRARRYVLGNLLDIDFSILGGRGEAKAPKLRSGERFRMRTPTSVTAVRGTEFRVAYEEGAGRTLTEVVEGTVAVAAGADETPTPARFGVASTASGVGTIEALLPPPAMIDPGAVQTGEVLEFVIKPQDSAKGYRTEVARDAGFLEVLGEEVTADGSVTLPPLENGRYFVRSRAISQSDLEGLSEAYSFRRKRLGVTAQVAQSPLADGYLFKWLAETAAGDEGETFFAFRMWREGEDASPLVDETGMRDTGLVLTDLEPGVYHWQVAAIQAVEEGMLKIWGPEQKLTVSE